MQHVTSFSTLSQTEKIALGDCRSADEVLGFAKIFIADHYNDEDLITTLGSSLASQPGKEQALEDIESILMEADKNNNSVAIGVMGELFFLCGDNEKAEARFEAALELEPLCGPTLLRMGQFKMVQGDLQQAFLYLNEAIGSEPENAFFHYVNGKTRELSGAGKEAIESFQKALDLEPSNERYVASLGNLFQKVRYDNYSETIETKLQELVLNCAHYSRMESFWGGAESLLSNKPSINKLLNLQSSSTSSVEVADVLSDLGEEKLLTLCMMAFPINSAVYQRLISSLRQMLLQPGGFHFEGPPLQGLGALSVQCKLNGDVYWDEEAHLADSLIEDLSSEIQNQLKEPLGQFSLGSILLMGCYRPLTGFSWSEDLFGRLRQDFSKERWFEVHFAEKLASEAIKMPIEQLNQAENAEELESIQASSLPASPQLWSYAKPLEPQFFDSILLRSSPEEVQGSQLNVSSPEVLVTSAGTGRDAVEFAFHSSARIFAIDVNQANLEFGNRKILELGLPNIRLARGTVFDIPAETEGFELVSVSENLSLSPDPESLLEAHLNLVKRGGILSIKVLSEVAEQALARVEGYISADSQTPAATQLYQSMVSFKEEGKVLENLAGLFNKKFVSHLFASRRPVFWGTRSLVHCIESAQVSLSALEAIDESGRLEQIPHFFRDFEGERSSYNYPNVISNAEEIAEKMNIAEYRVWLRKL